MASTELNQLLNHAQIDASSSQLASLLQQRKMLQHNMGSSVYQANCQLLNDKYEVVYLTTISAMIYDFYRLGEDNVFYQTTWNSSKAFHQVSELSSCNIPLISETKLY